jgi:hypothetical protein
MIYWLYWLYFYYSPAVNHIGGVMVSILASRAVDRGFEHQLNKAKHYKMKIHFYVVKTIYRGMDLPITGLALPVPNQDLGFQCHM